MPLDEQLNVQQRDMQQLRASDRYIEAEQNQMFQYVLPNEKTLNNAQKSEWKKADKLKSKHKKSQKKIDSLYEKITRTTDPEKMEDLEIKLKRENLNMALTDMQEQQMRLSVLPGQLAMKKKAEMDSLLTIITLRKELMDLYAGKESLNEEESAFMRSQQAAIRREAEAYDKAQKLHDTQVRLVMAKKETREAHENHTMTDEQALQEFRNIPMSLESIQKEYVYEHIEECVQQIQLIQQVKEIMQKPEWKSRFPMASERMNLEFKLEGLQEYAAHIQALFLDMDIDILEDNLKIQNTPEAISKRRAYLAGGRLRLEKVYRTYQQNDLQKIYHRQVDETKEDLKKIERSNLAGNDPADATAAYTAFGEDWLKEFETNEASVAISMEYQKLIELMERPDVQQLLEREPIRYLRLYQLSKQDSRSDLIAGLTIGAANDWEKRHKKTLEAELKTNPKEKRKKELEEELKKKLKLPTIENYTPARNRFIQMMGEVLQANNIDADAFTDQQQDEDVILEQRLSDLEVELEIRPLNQEEAERESQKIVKRMSRPVRAQGQGGNGEVKADFEDALGTMNRFYEKSRLLTIYYNMKEKVKDPVFSSIDEYMENYVGIFRQTKEDRQNYQQREGLALNTLQRKLAGVLTQTSGQAFRYASLLQSLLTENTDGLLKIQEKGIHVTHKDEDFVLKKKAKIWVDWKLRPLFPHAPGIKDVEQGRLGDCYLLAALNAILSTTPERIRECMKDNGDGTVTVRFFTDNNEPMYVTVEKTVPLNDFHKDSYAQGALWVQMIEKAYVASGLHVDDEKKKEKLKNNEKLEYQDIVGGNSVVFLQYLLGSTDAKDKLIKTEDLQEIATKNILNRIPGSVQGNDYKGSFKKDQQTEFLHELLTEEGQRKLKTVYRGDPAAESKRWVAQFDSQLKQIRLHMSMINDVAVISERPIEKITNAQELQNWLREIKTTIHNYRNDPKSVRKFLRETLDQYQYDDFQIDEFDRTVDQLISRLDNDQLQPVRDNIYADAENSLYQDISDALAEGKYVVAGTKKLNDNKSGRNGESERAGMVGTHAYTIMGTKEQVIGGVTHKYVMLMNPWAEHGVKYKEKEGNPDEIEAIVADEEQEEGVFLLDLRDFFYVVNHWGYVSGGK